MLVTEVRDLFLLVTWDTLAISTIVRPIGKDGILRTAFLPMVDTRRFSSKITSKERSIKIRGSIKQSLTQEEYNREILHTKRGFLSGTRAGALGTFRVTPTTAENGVSTIMAESTIKTTFKQQQAKTISKMILSCGFEMVEALLLAVMRIRHRQGSATEKWLNVV